MSHWRDILLEISAINEVSGLPDTTAPVLEWLGQENPPIQVAVLGQFKSGKSSLINSLLEDAILPVGVIPVTSVITSVEFSSSPKVTMVYHNGTRVEKDPGSLSQYSTEKGNPGNRDGISLASVGHPSMSRYRHLRLVDTPGLSSINQRNTDTTRQWLPVAGAAIIAISSERPLSDEDLLLIRGTMSVTPVVSIVVTKADLLDPLALNEVHSYIQDKVFQATEKKIAVYNYSIRDNFVVERALFCREVLESLESDYAKELERIIQYKISAIRDESIQCTRLALQAALKKKDGKEKIGAILDEIRTNRHHQVREMMLTSSAMKSEVRPRLETLILPYEPDITTGLRTVFNEKFPAWNGSLNKIARLFEKWMAESLGEEIRAIDDSLQEPLEKIVGETMAYFQYSARLFRQKLDEKLYDQFGLTLPEDYWQLNRIEIDILDVSIYFSFDSHLDMLLFFLPMRRFGWAFRNHFSRRIAIETEKNLYRNVSDLTGKLIRTIDDLYQQSQRFISDQMRWVEAVLQEARTNDEMLKDCLVKLEQLAAYEYNG